MTYLELAPAITAIRARPEEFEFSNGTLHHVRSRHRFNFLSEDDVQIHAHCDCSLLRASREQTKAFHAAYREWQISYWRPLGINREFASHFAPDYLMQALAIHMRLINREDETNYKFSAQFYKFLQDENGKRK